MKFLLTLLFCGAISTVPIEGAVLVAHGDMWRYRPATTAPPANWQTLTDAALDGSWLSAAGGFGYGDPGIAGEATTLNTMSNSYRSLTIRKTFPVPAPIDPNNRLFLKVDWDDGFVAYLDGVPLITNNAPASLAHNASAPSSREASCCDGTTNPAQTFDLGPVASRLPVGDHILAVQGWNQSLTSSDFHLIVDLSHDPPIPGGVSGAITTDTTWYAASNTYNVVGTVTVNSGVTLTIEPGVTVRFGQGLSLNVNGRLLAEGTPSNRIFFTRSPGATSWSTLEFLANNTTSRVAFADLAYSTGNIDANGTTLYLQGLWFTNTSSQMIDLVNSSITLLDSYFPSANSAELIHFSSFPANGHALIQGNVFGGTSGYNDIIDFTSGANAGNRPQPIVRFLDNVFLAAVDDCFDMDGTDAHIEGNIFLNVRKVGTRDSSSNPITTGADGSRRSELVICRNLFYDCEHAFMEKDNGTGILQNNTILRLSTNSVSDNTSAEGNEAPGIIMFGEPWRSGPPPAGDGVIFEGNIAADLRLEDPWPVLSWAQSFAGFFFIRNYNCIQGFPQPGLGNLSSDPLFVSPNNLTPVNIRASLALQSGSPCRGTGPNGLDMGALVPAGASISGSPASPTTNTSANLKIAGPGIWAYRWRLNGGPWSAEVSLVPQSIWNGAPFTANMFANAPPIALANLTDGTYTVEVIGRNSAGAWQDPGTAASVTWTVATTTPLVITDPMRQGNTMTFTFVAQSGQPYVVLYRDAFDAAHPWTWLDDIPPQGMTGPYVFTDNTATPSTRFYRIEIPTQP